MEFIYKTEVTMKPYNRKNWWIDSGIVRDVRIYAVNLEAALKEYAAIVKEKYCVEISDNALKNKQPMYVDTKYGEKQVGYVITGRTEFDDGNYHWSKQYIDLWVEVLSIIETTFPAA